MNVAARVAAALALTLAARTTRAQDLPCRLDGRLLPAARAALQDPPPSAAVIRALTEGAAMRAPEVLTWTAAGGDEASRVQRLRAWIESRASADAARCAVVTDRERSAAALVPRLAEVLDDPGEQGALRWRVALPANAVSPQVVIAPDEGPIARVDIDGEGRASATLHGGATMQVVLTMGGDPQVWARWRTGPDAPWATPRVDDELGVRRAVDGVRRRAGRVPLRPDPIASMIAARRARALADARRLTHVVGGEDPIDTLVRARVRAGVVAEVIGRGPTLTDAIGAVLGSPSHRERLESPPLRVIGVGAARAEGQVYLVVLLTDGTALMDGAP